MILSKLYRAIMQNFLIRGWRGNVPLSTTFWAYVVLGYFALSTINGLILLATLVINYPGNFLTISQGNADGLQEAFKNSFKVLLPYIMASHAIFFVYSSVAVWRSASRNSNRFWKYLAKIFSLILMILFVVYIFITIITCIMNKS
jgi:Na+/alanine symporter